MELFVIDCGNATIKATNSKGPFYTIPSYIAEDTREANEYTGSVQSKHDIARFNCELDANRTYIFGENILNVENVHLRSTYTHNDRYEKQAFQLSMKFMLAELAKDFDDDNIEVMLVTGIPSEEKGTVQEKNFREWLKGKHLVKRNGVEYVINVKDVQILPQPFGTIMDLFLYENGQVDERTRGNISVIDFGGGTTIIDTYNNLEWDRHRSRTIYNGQKDIYKNIASQLRQKNKSITVENVEQSFYDKDKFVKVSNEIMVDAKDEKSHEVTSFVQNIVTSFDNVIPDSSDINRLILTGGGVNNVGGEFMRQYKGIKIDMVDDSQTANVNGFYKFGKLLLERMK